MNADVKNRPPSPARKQRGTAAQVAEEADVSVFTVSRVFKGSPLVAEETRWRVFAAARRLGYRPRDVELAIQTRKLETVAFMRPLRAMSGEFYDSILAGLDSVLEPHKADLLLCDVADGTAPDEFARRILKSDRCQAIALFLNDYDKDTLHALAQLKAPIVLVNYLPPPGQTPGVSCAGFDQVSGVQQSVRHLYEIGHRDIAYFCCMPGWNDHNQRLEGYLKGMAEVGLSVEEGWVVPTPPPQRNCLVGAAGIDYIFSRGPRKPTAIVCGCDTTALGALSAARRWGKAIPADLSIVGFDDLHWTALYSPPLTTVRHHGWDLGVAVGQTLIEQHLDPTRSPETVILPTELIVRESTAPPRPLL